jgi:hypothetical protein
MAQLSFKEQLDAHGDEQDVRDRMAQGLYTGFHLAVAQEWLRKQEEARASVTTAAREAREERMVSAASKAAEAAFEQARWAKWAAIIAAIAAVIATKDQIILLIFGAP